MMDGRLVTTFGICFYFVGAVVRRRLSLLRAVDLSVVARRCLTKDPVRRSLEAGFILRFLFANLIFVL
jgi:hypothetical protein